MKHNTYLLFILIYLVLPVVSAWTKPLNIGEGVSGGLANASSNPKASTTRSIEQYGITWTFANNVEFGQFVNGDYWVIDRGTGIKIIKISPGFVSSPRSMNGSMLNPSTVIQGYDSFTADSDVAPYSSSKNIAIGISESTPLILSGNASLVSTISNPTPGAGVHASIVKTAAVLTCLSSTPPQGSFRPGISGENKMLYNSNNLQWNLLKNLEIPSGEMVTSSTLSKYAGYFQMAWLDHNGSYKNRMLHPSDSGINNYYFPKTFATAALLLHLNFTKDEKRNLLINYVQLGIDIFSFLKSGANGWPPDGGHSNGRKWPILFVGLMLNDTEMKNIGKVSGDYIYANGHGPGNPPHEYKHFGEDGQTFYVRQADVVITNSSLWQPDRRSAPNYPYTPAMIGMPEWGIRYSTYPQYSDSSWKAIYRTIGSGVPSWAGFALAARMMKAKELWNHDAFFDYVDRYMAISSGKPDPFGYKVEREVAGGGPDEFVAAMWKKYRENF
jgi:hypothetical protein